jgi:hypothetical protein
MAVTLVAAAVPVGYALIHLNNGQFRDDFISNLAATVVGLLVGIPVALELNRRQQASQEVRADEANAKEIAVRKKRILQLLRNELDIDRQLILHRKGTGSGGQRGVSLPGLKDEVWNAFSDGGELQWLQSPDLLDSIATAYHSIRSIIYLEQRYFEATHFPGVQVKQAKYPKDYILEYLDSLDPGTVKTIEGSVAAIDAALNEYRSPKPHLGAPL